MPKQPLHLDVETRSTVDLKKTGVYTYFAHPSTELYCAAYAFGDEGEVELWTPDQPCPHEIVKHIADGGPIIAWNSAFERQCWNKLLVRRYGWPEAKLEQFTCTMAEAFAMNLPGKLEDAAPALGLDIVKDNEGHRLMLQMCKPRKPRKDEPVGALLWYDDDARRQRLYEYCMQDVRTEQAVGTRVLRLRPSELKVFHLDAKINDRGVYVDAELCNQAKKIVAKETERLDARMRAVTNNEVQGVSNVQQIIQFLQKRGIDTKTVAKDIIEDLLILDLPADCRAALETRQEGAKTSTAKIDAMLSRRDEDGRMRGNLQYHGAGTGRWAARGAQLQNLPRLYLVTDDRGDFDEKIYDTAINTIMTGSNVMLEMMWGRPMTVISDCLRGMIKAAPGNELMAADFSNIEGRDTAWLAGQDDKLDAFKSYDDGTGPDLYLVAAGGVYGCAPQEARPYRQVGKVCELALGFEGGPGAFANMAKNYGLKVGMLYEGICERAPAAIVVAANQAWEWRGKKSGMDERSWVAAEIIKRMWRIKNHRIAEGWKELNAAALDAFDNPGVFFEACRVKYLVNGSFLWCKLPSGRALCYPYPRLRANVVVETPEGDETVPRDEAVKKGMLIKKNARSSLVYKGVDQWTRKWTEKPFYGGLAMENIAQAVARDVMADAMLRVEGAGYRVVLTVHDEVVVEVPKGRGSLEEFDALMSVVPSWAEGLPISAKGWRGARYHK